MKGLFITFEGGEGTGKSTVIRKLSDYLTAHEYNLVVTREPGGTDIAEKIRNVILDVNNDMSPLTEAYLYAASRIEHIEKKIKPALDEGKIVISDRYIDSSLVYQGIARKIGLEEILKINSHALNFMPDKTFIIDVKPEIALKRIETNNRATNRLDLEKISFHKTVYDGYQKLYEMYPNRITIINGDVPKDEVYDLVLSEVVKLLK